jgi:peptidyl-prolyl cis-trans isomerase SurA
MAFLMKRVQKTIAVVAFLLLLSVFAHPPAYAGDVIDRIVATVNGRIILQSDLDEALCYEALLSGRPLSQFTDEDRRNVLDRLIDQELLAEQMKSSLFRHASDDEAEASVAAARKQYSSPNNAPDDAADNDKEWQAVLARFGLTEKDVVDHVRRQIDLMRLVDARLRPTVQIDSKSIEAYYREKFVPELKQSGAGDVPLAQVSGKIRELLTQEKVNELMVTWLQSLRAESKVSLPGAAESPQDGVQSR